MKIIKPYARIIRTTEDALCAIEWCARISHRSEDGQKEESWRRFIQNVVLEHGDWSVVEHVSATVDMTVDRGVTHEWVRHRLFSFTQESTRFVNYEKKMPPSFIYPKPEVECEHCLEGNEPTTGTTPMHYYSAGAQNCAYESTWLYAIDQAERSYRELIKSGWRPQEARSVFPNALASRIITTGNLRNWRHAFIMRTTQEAHPQMRQVMIPLLVEFQRTFPLLFNDIEPNQKQSEAMKRIR